MSYSTVDDVRRYARGITVEKVTDADIQSFIDAADAMIDELTGHSWIETTGQIDYYDGDTKDELLLRHRPVLAITEIAKRITGPAWEALDEFDPDTGEGDYILEKLAAGVVRWTSADRAQTGTLAHRVTYNFGYSTTPGYIEALSAILAAISTLMRAAGETSPDGLVSISEGALSLSWGGGPYQDSISNLKEQADALLTKAVGRRINYHPSAK